jgi:hypothetical protein
MDQSKAERAQAMWLVGLEYGWAVARPTWSEGDGRGLTAKLRALLDYYALTRGVGHTQLLLTGTRHTSRTDALILALTQQHADTLTHESTLPRGRGLSWGELPAALERLRGERRPLAVDHGVLQTVLEECFQEMARLMARAHVAEQALAASQARAQTARTPGAEDPGQAGA